MYLNSLHIISIIFSVLFLVLFFRTFNWKKLKAAWRQSVKAGTQKFDFLQKVKDLKSKGLKEFTFNRGKFSVWAENKAKAGQQLMFSEARRKESERKKRLQKKIEKRNADRRRAKHKRTQRTSDNY
jgi:biopolymer transport protein ExbB/TolQ